MRYYYLKYTCTYNNRSSVPSLSLIGEYAGVTSRAPPSSGFVHVVSASSVVRTKLTSLFNLTPSELQRGTDHAGASAWRRVPQLRGWHHRRPDQVPRLPWWLVSVRTLFTQFPPTVFFGVWVTGWQSTRLHTALFSDCTILVRRRI